MKTNRLRFRFPTAAALTGLLALHPLPSFQGEAFKKVKLMVQREGKGKLVKARLLFEADRIVIAERKTGAPMKEIPYEKVLGGEYSHSKHPRWKTGAGVAAAVGVFAIPIFFMKGKSHWLTIRAEGDFAVLRLHKKNWRSVNAAFEARTGKEVERIEDEK